MKIDRFARNNMSLFILLLLALGANAQLPDKQHFLWYKGHWSPTKKNVFVIEKDSNALTGFSTGSGTLTIDPDGSIHAAGVGLDEWNKKIDDGERQLDQWTQQLQNPTYTMDPADHHLSDLLLPAAQEEQQNWSGYKIDPKQDLLRPETRPGSPPPSTRSMAAVAEDFCRASKADYDLVMAFYHAHKGDKDADLNIPPPPEFEYECYACDSNIRKNYDTTIAHYVRDFMHPEDSILRKALGLMRGIQLLTGSDQSVLPEEIAQAWSKSGACHYFSQGDLAEAIQTTITHAYRRATNLVIKYRRDFRAAPAIARAYLGVARDYVIWTGNSGTTDYYMAEMTGIFAKSFDFYLTKLKQNDWRQIANIPLMLGICRQISLMGGDAGDHNFKDYINRIALVLNNFILTVDMDVKIGRGRGYWLSHVKGKCHIGPDFVRDSNQCYKWVVLDENHPDYMGFYRTKAIPQFDCDLVANEIGAPGASPVYTGSKKYTGNLEGLRMDFCNPGKDTIVLSNFAPNPANDGWFRFPQGINQNLGVTGEQFFSDENAKKRLAESGQVQEAANKFQAQSQQTIDQMKELAAKMQSDTGRKTMADYQKIMEMSNKIQAAAAAPIMAQMLWIDFEIPVKNGDPVLVDKIFDAKEINPQMAPAFQYAHYTIHIENKTNVKKQ